MNIVIMTYGTRGDVQPYLALGLGLRERGHVVTIVTSERFRGFITDYGLNFGPMSDDLLAILDTEEGQDLIENTANVFDVLMKALSMVKRIGPIQEALLNDSWNAAKAADPDLILFHPKAFGGLHVAEKLNIPAILGLPIPMMIPTSERPNPGFYDLKIGGWYNRFTYASIDMIMGLASGGLIRRWREAHGLPKAKVLSLTRKANGDILPSLVAVSPHVVSQPSDWPDTARMIGYWFLDTAKDWEPPEDLAAFLSAGPPPVYVGFGSMTGRHPERLAQIAVDALKVSGQRGIIATGWGGLKPTDLPPDIFSLDQAPHDWLFPRMAAIVHHGGAGTTAAAIRAGKPSVIVPFIADQPFWGQTVQSLGIGSAPVPHKKMNAGTLGKAILQVTSDQTIRDRAEALGTLVRRENGIAAAADFIEKYLK